MSFLVHRSFCFLQKIFLFFSLLTLFFLKWKTPISFRCTKISAISLLFYYKRGDISPQKQFFWTTKVLSWQGEVVKVDFYWESEGQGEAFKLKRRGEHLKEKHKVLASFKRIEKKGKAEKWKSGGATNCFLWDGEKRKTRRICLIYFE